MVKKIIGFLGIVGLVLGMPLEAEAEGTYLSEEIITYCEEIGNEYGICPEMLEAMIEAESTGNPEAVNGSCKGLMQVSEKWHKDRMARLGVTDIYDEYGNILTATDYLSDLFIEYEDDALVLMIYNGDSNAKAFARGECDMSGYASKILTRAYELERNYIDGRLAEKKRKCTGLARRDSRVEHKVKKVI